MEAHRLLAARVLRDSLGAFADGVLGQLAWQQETDGSLDLSAGDGGALVVVSQAAGLTGDALKDVVDEAVHDGHGLAADTSVRMDLLQHLVDVDGIRLPPASVALLLVTRGTRLGRGLLRSFA